MGVAVVDSGGANIASVLHALRRLGEATGTRRGFRARLHKRIPVGGGLGDSCESDSSLLSDRNPGHTIGVGAVREGLVTVDTVSEQLLYELGDPQTYITPDCGAVLVIGRSVRLQ